MKVKEKTCGMYPRATPSTAGLRLRSYGFQLRTEGMAWLSGLCLRSWQSGHCRYSWIYFIRSVCSWVFPPRCSFPFLHTASGKNLTLSIIHQGLSVASPSCTPQWVIANGGPVNRHYSHPDPMRSGRFFYTITFTDVAVCSSGTSSCADSV